MMRYLNKPFKAHFTLTNWEILITNKGKLRVKGYLAGNKREIYITSPLIKFDEEAGTAESQIHTFKLLEKKGVR